MSKKALSVALLAVLGTMVVGCQKENIAELRSEKSISKMGTMFMVQYTVDGVLHIEKLYSEEEYNTLLTQLMCLSRSGAVVEIAGDNYSPNAFPAKESITYTTSSDADAAAWTQQKTKEGYRVRVTYDTTKNVHICTAYK